MVLRKGWYRAQMIREIDYMQRIWGVRYFWLHLTSAELRTKYRRSMIGPMWSIIQPLAMTMLLAFVMGKLMGVPIGDYALYIFSGVVVWEYMTGSVNTGCKCLYTAAPYIKQFAHPVLIYPLRYSLAGLVNLMLASVGLIGWALVVHPENLNISWLFIPMAMVMFFLIAWPLASLCAVIATYFYDFTQLVGILMQIVYYVSPVFLKASMFEKAGIGYLLEWNPVYHLLQLLRAPLLAGEFPSLFNIGFVLATAMLLWLMTFITLRRVEQKIIFYL
ncbi:ABC transporter permease [bacterium]|nr:ABC transporter permease [bacterium]